MNPKVLIVEDEPAIADTIQYALETEGFDTRHLAAGRPVLEILDEATIDLIVLDIGLPDISGIELCLEIGGDDYVTKPFSPRELAARVRAVLRRGATAPEGAVTAPDFNLDESRRLITYCGTPLELSHYEYRLMRIFIQRPGHVYSREQLMNLAWDEPESSMDRTVDAHIKNLRAKLKSVRPNHDPIVTHRGVGYSLKEDL